MAAERHNVISPLTHDGKGIEEKARAHSVSHIHKTKKLTPASMFYCPQFKTGLGGGSSAIPLPAPSEAFNHGK